MGIWELGFGKLQTPNPQPLIPSPRGLRTAVNESEAGPTFDNKPDAPGNASGSFSIASHGKGEALDLVEGKNLGSRIICVNLC